MSGPSDPSPPGAPAPEVRRRRREGWIILTTAIAVVVLVLFETRLPQSPGTGSLGSDALLIALIDLNLILLVLLVFLVGRHVVKLIFERRRGAMGAHLRTKLVGAFVAIALLPATFLFITALVFVSNSIEKWFESEVEESLAGAVEVAHAYYQDLARTGVRFARQMSGDLAAAGLATRDARAALKERLTARRAEYQLDLVEVFRDGRVLARARRPELRGRFGSSPGAALVRRASDGIESTGLDELGEADMIRAAAPLVVDGRTVGAVLVGTYIPRSVVKWRRELEQNFNDYMRLKPQRRPIKTNYTIMLAVVTLVALFSAIWLGFYMARGIAVPIQRLAEATRRVAQGDLEQRIEGEGDDELGTLVGAFNRMTSDLQTSRAELDARRRYLETVLGNVAAGVVSTDAAGHITTMNRAAEALLGRRAAACVGRSLDEVFAADGFADVRQLAAQLRAGAPDWAQRTPVLVLDGINGRHGDAPVERQVTMARDGEELAVLLTGTRLVDEAGASAGLVLFLEDVTHLLRVQRMEAWREVARRIAHEIKNPLTPIALSADRLRRRYGAQLADSDTFDECTRTIIQQVDSLKALVNEFSTFARMPAGVHTQEDLNRLVDEALVLFREGHREIDFAFEPDPALPVLELDREGIRRAVINVLDNAVAALAERRAGAGEARGRIELRTQHDEPLGMVRLEIADDGPGMVPEVKARLFEPYFSTKPDGTGLGLAIVSAIVADHNGFIRVRDNVPRGSRFIMEFPVRGRTAQLAVRAQRGAWAGA
jgi:two-component system, NtrC family, nitrogen regulation sensor histidine kinase NtrY